MIGRLRSRVVRQAILLCLVPPLASCQYLAGNLRHAQKFCGRDYGDRVHWTTVPHWFKAADCEKLYPDGPLWSDLFLGCYSREGGLVAGTGSLKAPNPNRCHWQAFLF